MAKSKKFNKQINGWLNLYKPKGCSSAKAVYLAQKITGAKKVGHAGTLDPLAYGVLPLAFGEATKTIQYLQNNKKEYEFIIQFGKETTTYDAEGDTVNECDYIPSKKEIEYILKDFIGEIEQIPPKYSAIKIDGKRAYKIARKGEEVKIPSRKITIYSLSVVNYPNKSSVKLVTSCSKGTYIRTLAVDIARKLGSLGYVSELIRTKVDFFSIKDTVSLDNLEKIVQIASDLDDDLDGDSGGKENKNISLSCLLPVYAVLDDIPVLHINSDLARDIRDGKLVPHNESFEQEIIKLFYKDELLALVDCSNNYLKPIRVFNLVNI